jgi:hypothetical protein
VNGGVTAPHDDVTEHQTTEPVLGVEASADASIDERSNE